MIKWRYLLSYQIAWVLVGLTIKVKQFRAQGSFHCWCESYLIEDVIGGRGQLLMEIMGISAFYIRPLVFSCFYEQHHFGAGIKLILICRSNIFLLDIFSDQVESAARNHRDLWRNDVWKVLLNLIKTNYMIVTKCFITIQHYILTIFQFAQLLGSSFDPIYE